MGDFAHCWGLPDGDFGKKIAELNDVALRGYATEPQRINSDGRAEKDIYQGLYKLRRLVELVQNGADAIGGLGTERAGRISLVLSEAGLYCANEGEPFTLDGVRSLRLSFASPKTGSEIGRFGRGFKSVLALTDEPHVYSRSGSFRFSQSYTRSALSAIPDIKAYLDRDQSVEVPYLAIAECIDPRSAAASDPVLEELMAWATTVVFLPFSKSHRFLEDSPETRYDSLSDEFHGFDAEFLIFAKHVNQLDFSVLGRREARRSLSCLFHREPERVEMPSVAISRCSIRENEEREQIWRLLEVPPIPVGSEHMGLDINRRRGPDNKVLPVPLAWAVPSAVAKRGRFWFFFPTKEEMSLGGIANAPWDTNNERTHLLGASNYNRMLIGELAKLVASAVPYLASLWPEDAAAYLELLPARGREELEGPPTWVVDMVKKELANVPCLPDLDGQIQISERLRRPPEGIPLEIQEAWAAVPGSPRNLVHPRAVDPARTVRGARVRELLELHNRERALEVSEWVELLVGHGADPAAASVRAIEVARVIAEYSGVMKERVVEAGIVLLADGTFVAPDPARVYLPGRIDARGDFSVVHREVVSDPGALHTLREVFGLKELDQSAHLQQVLTDWPARAVEHDWSSLWLAARAVEPASAVSLIMSHFDDGDVAVRCVSGRWKSISEALLPGEVVQADGQDPDLTIDVQHHEEDLPLLRGLGATTVPVQYQPNGPLADEYRRSAMERLLTNGVSRPDAEQAVRILPTAPSHLGLLSQLSLDAAARLTAVALLSPGGIEPWSPIHASRSELPAFGLWAIKRAGVLRTSHGARRVKECLHPEMARFARVLPVAMQIQARVADLLALPRDPASLPREELAEAVERLSDEVDDQLIGEVLSLAVEHIPKPAVIRCRLKDQHVLREPSEVYVVTDPVRFQAIVATGAPTLCVASQGSASMLEERWDLKGADNLDESIDHADLGPAELLTDVFFMLGELRPLQAAGKEVQRCSWLVRVSTSEHGRSETRTESALEGEIVYVESLDDDPIRILDAVNRELKLDLTPEERQSVLENKRSANAERLLSDCRSLGTDEDRVRLLFSPSQLRKLLPAALVEEVGSAVDDPTRAAGLALSVHGYELLQKLRTELNEVGLYPPANWAGSRRAVAFVRDLGFDPAFAGFKSADRSNEVLFNGPVALNPLHDYQSHLAAEIKSLVLERRSSKDGGWRGLLFLPTGAGKTRVAVQALLELVLESRLEKPVILWVAQTDELCEQAVQSFREVWGAIGSTGSLLVGRLWGGNHVSAAQDSDVVEDGDDWQAQVVVATIAKLDSAVVENEAYDWLLEAAVVVLDEAHQTTSTQYTRALRWLGTGTGRQVGIRNPEADRRPLLGLTATPFKSSGAETKTLLGRFGHNALTIQRPVDVADDAWSVESHLRDLGVLAQPVHRVLSGMRVEMSESELAELEKQQTVGLAAWLPAAVEERIAVNQERNRRLIDDIANRPPEWPVLVFAVSVVHAQLLAAQLKLRGIEAAAVSASTARGARHHYIRQFREGRIRVLTNFGVLTTGFDAPQTRAIYIARPTFSLSLYMQMIGRGLRGPLNGGKDECLIVDMDDNIERFHGRFAYAEVAHLWAES